MVFVGCTPIDKVPDTSNGGTEVDGNGNIIPYPSVTEYPATNIQKDADGNRKKEYVKVEKDQYITVEKPFVAMQKDSNNEYTKKYDLRVPKLRKGNAALGPDLYGKDDTVIDFTKVKVGVATIKKEVPPGPEVKDKDYKVVVYDPDMDVAGKLQKALDEGKHLVLSPGIYHLDRSLVIRNKDTVVLGLGLATLVAPKDGSPCIKVEPKTEGVRIAGIMLEASEPNRPWWCKSKSGDCLLEWGTKGCDNDPGNPESPGVLTDIFARVGGSNPSRKVSTEVIVRIHSGNVIGDNLWLWRADHVKPLEKDGKKIINFPKSVSPHYWQTEEGECPVKTGLEVNGDDVTIYGLAVEHTQEHQTVWNGERGNVQFYQCELPYDVTSSFADKEFRGYKVGEKVNNHKSRGVGVYSNFRDHEVLVPMAFYHPTDEKDGKRSIDFQQVFTKLLNNRPGIKTVLNGEGGSATDKGAPPTRIQPEEAPPSHLE